MLLNDPCICHKVKGRELRLTPTSSSKKWEFNSKEWFQIDFESLYRMIRRNVYSWVTLTLKGLDEPFYFVASSKPDVLNRTLGPFKPGRYQLALFCKHEIHHTGYPAEDCTAKATIYPVKQPIEVGNFTI